MGDDTHPGEDRAGKGEGAHIAAVGGDRGAHTAAATTGLDKERASGIGYGGERGGGGKTTSSTTTDLGDGRDRGSGGDVQGAQIDQGEERPGHASGGSNMHGA
uniref:Uncharacterized protein n=1 Tax=Oryza glaberrima TaxID=4538 RepID=I1NKV3_ORYGL